MIVILDERDLERIQSHDRAGTTIKNVAFEKHRGLIQLAEYVAVIKEETYAVIKDRYTGETNEYPLDEFPSVIEQRLFDILKRREIQ
jgi:hypothetical protein